MIGLIITDSHLLAGEWSSIHRDRVLSNLKYVALSKPIKEVLKSKDKIYQIFTEALANIDLKDNKVIIAIDDELLYHDKFASEESISKREIWEYLQWEKKQRWGEIGKYYTTFAEIDSPNKNVVHSITCPSYIISELRAIVSSLGGTPTWAGPTSSIHLANNQFKNAVYITNDEKYLQYFFRGKTGYGKGSLRFIDDRAISKAILGNQDEQIDLFSDENIKITDYVSIGLIPERKKESLQNFNHKQMIPFENIEVKVDDIPENVPFSLLNTLSSIIKELPISGLINFFNPTQIQELNLAGKTGLDAPLIEADPIVKSESITKLKKKSLKKKKDKKPQGNRLLPYLLLILLSALIYYFFFNDKGIEMFSSFSNKIGFTKSFDIPDKMTSIDLEHNQSVSLIKSYFVVTSVISPDSIIALKLDQRGGYVEFVGKDSVDIPLIEAVDYSIDPIDCCGGIKQNFYFNIKLFNEIRSNLWLDSSDIIHQLTNSFGISKLRQLEPKDLNGIQYTPIICEADSIEMTDKVIQYLKFVGSNVMLKKIDISNVPPMDNYSCTIYLAIFQKP